MRKILMLFVLSLVLTFGVGSTMAGSPCDSTGSSTAVPGHCDRDGTVVGHYTSVFAYEGAYGPEYYPQEDWYWDLGDGRIFGTVDSIAELDQDRLTVCDYVVNYRGDFMGDPYQDTGWIQNHINCTGYDDDNHYNYLMVHESDPRYTGEGIPLWDEWEYHVLTISGWGNLARPETPVGN